MTSSDHVGAEQDRLARHLRRYRSDSLDLLDQAVQHPLRDRPFVPLDIDFKQNQRARSFVPL